MSFVVTIRITREFETTASSGKVFALLSDVPASASHFPDVERLDDLGGNVFLWTMEKIGIGDHTLQQTVYACTYRSDIGNLSVDWQPVEGTGNAKVSGGWRLHPAAAGTRVELKTQGVLTVDLPGFLQLFLSPLIEMAFIQKIDRYISSLREALDRQ